MDNVTMTAIVIAEGSRLEQLAEPCGVHRAGVWQNGHVVWESDASLRERLLLRLQSKFASGPTQNIDPDVRAAATLDRMDIAPDFPWDLT